MRRSNRRSRRLSRAARSLRKHVSGSQRLSEAKPSHPMSNIRYRVHLPDLLGRETREKMSRSTAGKNNPNWRGGQVQRYGSSWGPARAKVRARDEVCQNCGEDGSDRRLHVHHIIPVRKFRDSEQHELEDAHTLENLVQLCDRCHAKVEHGTIELERKSGGRLPVESNPSLEPRISLCLL